MGRFSLKAESQVAQLSGLNATTTVNGVIGALVGGSAANCKLRRLKIGMRAGGSSIPVQQITIALHRQTVRAVGTGLTNIVGQNLDPRGAASAISGFDVSTATTLGTTGWTLNAAAIDEFSFNSQAGLDLPWDYMEELIIDQGTANGIALVNIGNTLPVAGLITIGIEWEE